MTTLESIIRHKLVAIIRGYSVRETLEIITALHSGGMRIVEVTLNSPDALKSIEEACKAKMEGLFVGAGTVLTSNQAEAAIGAGARFIISPGTDVGTIKKTKELGAVSIPGAFTPTEVIAASHAGGDIIKIFPSVLGPSYIKDLRGPLNEVKLMPTGGVTVENIPAYLKAGAIAFGIAGSLLKSTNTGDRRLEDIQSNASSLVKVTLENV